MTALEKIDAPPTRLGGTALYDWDHLVQEDRAHRLIYTDPAIFEAEMTNIFGGTWTYLAHESEIPNDNDFITRRLGLRPLIIVRDANGKIRALYNRCTHRGTTLCRWDKGNTKSFQCPYHGWNFLNTGKLRGVPWPEGYAGRHARSEIQCRAGAARRILSRLHLRHAEHGRAAAHRASRFDRKDHRRMARPQSRRQGRGLRGEPVSLQGQLEARLRQFMRRLSRRLFAPLAVGNREPLRRRERQGHGLLPQLARHPADVHALYRPRQSLQGQAAESGKAAGRLVGAGKRASRHGALRGRIHQTLRRPRLRAARPRRLRAGQHQRVSRIFRCSATTSRCSSRSASRKPTPSGTAP